MSDSASDHLFRAGKYEEAAEKLRKGLAEQGENGRDQLLYLLDLGLTLHAAGKYEESNKAFFEAERIADIKDYTSLTTESATLLTTDSIRDYKGEDFEKVLINTYLAMNYSLMGDVDSALVEARKVNRKLHMMVTEGKRKYKQNAFARYLSAVLYESEGEWNDAYIDYKMTYELTPDYPALRLDLYRMAWKLGMHDEMDRWAEKLALTSEEKAEAKKLYARPRAGHGSLNAKERRQSATHTAPLGEIVVLYENGISPIKRPDPGFSQIPRFYPRFNPVRSAQIEVRKLASPSEVSLGSSAPASIGTPAGVTAELPETLITTVDTYRLHDIESTAIENLNEKWGGILAKKLAGVVAKQVVSKQVENVTKSPLLGALVNIAMYASDQADVRSWNLLPRDLQIARIPVEAGTYTLRAKPLGGDSLQERTVQVSAGKKVFVNFRYTPR